MLASLYSMPNASAQSPLAILRRQLQNGLHLGTVRLAAFGLTSVANLGNMLHKEDHPDAYVPGAHDTPQRCPQFASVAD